MMKSTSTKYGTVAVTIHWISALVIFVLLVSGFRAGSLTSGADKADILSLHVPLGLTILLLTVLRVAWWALADKKPISQSSEPAWQTFSAKAVHVIFYIVIFGMAASGIGLIALSGAGAVLFGGGDGTLPNFHDYLPRTPHGIGARLMVLLIVAHAGAALYHHFIKKDGLIWRMWFGSKG